MDADEMEEENSEQELLEHLTEYECLDGAAHGIALQVLSKGRKSLTHKQEHVFQTFVVDKYYHLECSRCHDAMPTSEVIAALAEDDGLCSWCRKAESNDD